MKLNLLFVTVAFVIGSSSVLTEPLNDAQGTEGMALRKRIVYITGRIPRSEAAVFDRDVNEDNADQFQEVGLVKRTRHKHHRHRHGHHHGHKSKGMMAMPPAAAMGGGAAGGMAAGAPDMAAAGAADVGAGAADMSAAQ